jgi:predicted nucleic acid-binding protein
VKHFVVDASVAIKWYLREEHSAEADRLLDPQNELSAPDLLISEIGNILWKRVLRGDISVKKAGGIFGELQAGVLQILPAESIAAEALDIACRTKRTFYDSLYIAFAVRNDCKMVTADLKLYKAIKETAFRKYVLWVGDLPE